MSANSERVRSRALTRDEFQQFSPMVRRQAMWMARRGPRNISVSDLVAAGFRGLIDALGTAFDVDDIDAYVQHRVKCAMLQFIEALDPHLSETRSLSRSIARAVAALTRALERVPTQAEVAEVLAMTTDEYESCLLSIWRAGLARIEVIDLDRSMQEQLREDAESPTRNLAEAIELLPNQTQELLMLLYQENCSFDEAAAVIGTSVRKVELKVSHAMHVIRALTGRE